MAYEFEQVAGLRRTGQAKRRPVPLVVPVLRKEYAQG